MSKRTLIGLLVIVLLLAAGLGTYYVARSGEAGGAKNLTGQKESPKKEKEPIAKLVYVGTNETLSEALYNLDRQDGKLERAYIVHRVLGSTPDLGDNRHSLTFIGRDGKVKKEVLLESNRSKIDVYLTPKGNHALAASDYNGSGLYTARYYDVEGNILWEKKDTYNWYTFFPDGELLIEDEKREDGREYNLINAKGEVVKKKFCSIDYYYYSIEAGKMHPDYSSALILFAPNGKCFSMQFNDGDNKVTKVLVFTSNGDKLFEKEIKEFSADYNDIYLSNSGYYYVKGYEPYYSPFKRQIFYVFNDRGERIYKRVQERGKRIRDYAVLDDSFVYILAEDDQLNLVNIRTSEELQKYKGAGMGTVRIYRNMVVISESEKINENQGIYKVYIIGGNFNKEIYKGVIVGYQRSKDEVTSFKQIDGLLILINDSTHVHKVGRIYKME